MGTTMLKEHPDHHDADLVLRIYDLRRETVMRESRSALLRDYWPRTAEDAVDVLRSDHPLNRPWRQVTTYWEMVYGMARHGVIHAEFLVDNSAEGLVIFARAEPYLAQLREKSGPRALQHAEWVSKETDNGRRILEVMRVRVAKALAERAK
jgi:hypothetical protein